MPLPIETQRFFLSPFLISDIGEVYLSWLRDPEVVQWLNAQFRHHDANSAREWLAQHDNKDKFCLSVLVRDTKTHIGNISANIDRRHGTAMIGVMIGDKRWWGSGVVLEIREALLNWLFDEQNIHKVWSMPFVRNAPAIFNYRRQGFTCEGILRAHRRRSNGEYLDVAIFSMLRDEWMLRRKGRK
ncbi:MAG: GNAT family protein [Alphaproteobacteria bacterium]